MAKTFNPQALAQKWFNNYSRSGDNYKAGIMGVTQAPGIAAAAAAPKYAQRVQDAVSSGRYQNRVSSVPLNSWQQSSVNKGIPRMASGATSGQPKMQNYMQAAAPVYQDISSTAAGMVNDGSTASQAAIVSMAIDKMKALRNALK